STYPQTKRPDARQRSQKTTNCNQYVTACADIHSNNELNRIFCERKGKYMKKTAAVPVNFVTKYLQILSEGDVYAKPV
ncbi:hypothetical protein ACWLKK_17395, partial [Morganella morganii]